MVSSQMCSLNLNTIRSHFWINQSLSWKIFLLLRRLKGLNPTKALGPDELHPRVLKELTIELGPILSHLFQQLIDSGDVPKEWTLANINSLLKKGDRSLACKYRPVSLTCVACKSLENIVALWPTLVNINFCQTNNILVYSRSDLAVKLS